MHSATRTREWNESTYVPGHSLRTPDLKSPLDQAQPSCPVSNPRNQSLARSDTLQSRSSSSTRSSFWSDDSSPSSPASASSISNYPHSVAQTTDLLESLDQINMTNTPRDPWEVNSQSGMLSQSFEQLNRRPLFNAGPETEERLDVDLPCTFSFCNCTAKFRYRSSWEQHNLQHFGGLAPPPQTICIFCNTTFNHYDQAFNWELRMRHIFEHYVNNRVPGERPDFELIKYLYNNGRMSRSLYEQLTAYSEVSTHMDLNPTGTPVPQPHEWNKKPTMRYNVSIDLRKQDRQLKRARNNVRRRGDE